MNSGPSVSTPATPTSLGALADLRWQKAFWRHLWKHFKEDQCLAAAGSLSYTTMLALVPLMAVMIAVISAFPVFDVALVQIQTFIFQNFVPAAGDVILEYLQQFVERTAGLTGVGTVFLVVTAIVLMSTIEKSLNSIWRVTTPRRPASRIVVYWAVLTLGPLLIGASLAVTSYAAALPLLAQEFVGGWLQSAVLSMTPFVVALLAFALLFIVVPNRRVRWHHAFIGALVSAVLFELSKAAFVFYVSNFPAYEHLYGALAIIPLFLIWIYVSWVVILLGASVTAALTTFKYQRAEWQWPQRLELGLVLRLMGHFWQAQRRGGGLTPSELLFREPAATDAQLQRLVGHLVDAGMVQRDDDGDWFLTADLEEVTLGELYRAMPLVLPIDEISTLPCDHHWDLALREALNDIHKISGPHLDRPVKAYLTLAPAGDRPIRKQAST